MKSIFVILAALLLMVPASVAIVPQDDAGSGQDAPNSPLDVIRIQPGTIYEGNLTGTAGDPADYYSLLASAGDTIELRVSGGANGCLRIHEPNGAQATSTCFTLVNGVSVQTVATSSGVWFVGFTSSQWAQPYRFAVGLNAAAPDTDALPSLPPLPSLAPPSFIQPGARVSTPSGSCTLNFVYDGTGSRTGNVYIGTAAHCFTALNQAATVSSFGVVGHVVYMGDYGGVNTGSFDNGLPGTQVDFALILVDPAHHANVSAEVKGHPGLPAGGVMARSATSVGDRLDFSGYGTGFSLTQPTREMRSGVYYLSQGNNWAAIAPIAPGDSGGPVLHANGKAFGVATHISAFGAGGPWLEVAIAQAASPGGHSVVLRNA